MNVKLSQDGRSSAKIFFLCFFMFFICTGAFLIYNKGIYISYSDYNAQIIPIWFHIYDSVHSGIPAWDWMSGLGMNFWSSYTYYGLTDPFVLLSLLFPREYLLYAMSFIQALKFGLCGLTSYIYIKQYVKNDDSAFIGAVLYTFSGQQLFSMCFMLSEVYALFPLLLYSFDKLVTERRSAAFAFITALLGFTNYFFLYGACIFVIIYFCIRIICGDFKINGKLFLKISFEAVMGVLMCAAVLIPTYAMLRNNSRASESIFSKSLLAYEESETVWKVISSAFFIPDPISLPGFFSNSQLNVANVSLFLPFFGIVGVLVMCRENSGKWYSRLLMLCALFALLPFFNSMFSAFRSIYYARWFYMPLLIMAAVTGKFIDGFETAEMKKEIGLTAFCISFITLFSAVKIIQGDTSRLLFSVLYALLSLAILYDLRYGEKKYDVKKLKRLVCVFAAVPFVYIQIFMLYNVDNMSFQKTAYFNDYVPVNISDNDFFRVFQDNTKTNVSCTTLMWGYPQIDTFHNATTENETNFYNAAGNDFFLAYQNTGGSSAIQTFLSVKYDLYANKPLVGGVQVEPDHIQYKRPGFEQYDIQGNRIILRNTQFIPMGFTFDYYYPLSDLPASGKISDEEKTRREKLLLKAIWLTDEQTEKYKDILDELPGELAEDTSDEAYFTDCENRRNSAAYEFLPDKNGFTSRISCIKDSLVFYSVPYDEGFTAAVDGQETDIETVFNGLCAVFVPEGDHTVRFDYHVIGLKEGIAVSIAAAAVTVIYAVCAFVIRYRRKKRMIPENDKNSGEE